MLVMLVLVKKSTIGNSLVILFVSSMVLVIWLNETLLSPTESWEKRTPYRSLSSKKQYTISSKKDKKRSSKKAKIVYEKIQSYAITNQILRLL